MMASQAKIGLGPKQMTPIRDGAMHFFPKAEIRVGAIVFLIPSRSALSKNPQCDGINSF
jgi:hypothetical protein